MPLRCFWIFLVGIILILSSSRHRAENIEKKEEETTEDVPISNEEQTETNFKLDEDNEPETSVDLKTDTDKQKDEKIVKHENIPIIPDNTNVKIEKKLEETENKKEEKPQNTTKSDLKTTNHENLTKSTEKGNSVLEANETTQDTIIDEKISTEDMETTTPDVEVKMVKDPKEDIIDEILNQSVDEPTNGDVNSTKIVEEINDITVNDSHTESKPDVLTTTNYDLTQTVVEPESTDTVHLNKAVDSADQETTTTTPAEVSFHVKTEEQNEFILESEAKINKPEKEEEETEAASTADKVDVTTSNDNGVKNTDKQEVIVDSNKTTTANAEEKQNEENVKLEVDSIQSFEEWKKKQIQDRWTFSQETWSK
ncbi:uncharacterized protein LOC144744929 [Ciona intestinalis]